MTNDSLFFARLNCPCCGYPTLSERNAYEICELCNWEDDGQDSEDADDVWGGANSDYSLAEARLNFKQYRVMYEPGRDQRITGSDSSLQFETKGKLMICFEQIWKASPSEHESLAKDMARLEQILRDETTRRVREYERKHNGA